MKHYVLIDNHSGYVWDEADADDPIAACQIVDQRIDPGRARVYEEARLASNENGYHVYEAPAGWIEVKDGQDQREIERVEAECRHVATVASRRVAD